MRIFAIAFVIAFLLGSSAGGAVTVRSGLYGHVTRGPISPVCVAEQPCSEPAAGATLRFLRDGHLAGSVRVNTGGGYRILLAPAVYTVAAASRRPLDPSTVRVRTGVPVRRDFAIDTGIR